MKPLKANEINGNWATLISVWNDDGSLDAVRLGKEIDTLISMNVDGIYSNGTVGEFHCQREDEFDMISSILAAKCQAAGMPFQLGVSHMSAQLSLDRMRRSVHLAPGAFQIILPDWFPVSNSEAVIFLKTMAEEADGIGLVLYNPPHAKRILSPEEVAALKKEVPQLIGLKTAGGDDAWYASMRKHLSQMSVFIPGHFLASGIKRGANGSYSNMACLNPDASQKWMDLTATNMSRALELEKRIKFFLNEYIVKPHSGSERFCNAAYDRYMALVGNWADIGASMRWPYASIPVSGLEDTRKKLKEIIPEFYCHCHSNSSSSCE